MTRRVWILAVFLTFFVSLAQPGPTTCAAFFADVGGIEVADSPQAREVTLADLVTVLIALDPGTVPATLMFADPPARYNPDEHTVVVCTDDYLFVFVNDPFGLRIYNLRAQTSVEAKLMGLPLHAQSLRRGIYLVEVFNGDHGTAVFDVNTGEALLSLEGGGFSSYPTVLVDGNKFLVESNGFGTSTVNDQYLALYALLPKDGDKSRDAVVELASCRYKSSGFGAPQYTFVDNELFVTDKDGAEARLLPQSRPWPNVGRTRLWVYTPVADIVELNP